MYKHVHSFCQLIQTHIFKTIKFQNNEDSSSKFLICCKLLNYEKKFVDCFFFAEKISGSMQKKPPLRSLCIQSRRTILKYFLSNVCCKVKSSINIFIGKILSKLCNTVLPKQQLNVTITNETFFIFWVTVNITPLLCNY
jgi:hypothetical protein